VDLEESVLTVKNLNKSFGKHQTLFDINFECHKGHIIGLIGANGAGKTTIMKSILSLVKSEGQIRVNGQDINFDSHLALKNVGALIEYPGIYPFLSGRDHLKLFADKGQESGIQRIIDDFKMSNYIDQRAKGYSLGMKQKLGIAMAFLNDPNLIVLDEPMNGLDPQATRDLRNLIMKKKAQGVTFLISSHILGELQKLAEDLIVIDNGRVLQKTTMTDLLEKNKHYLILSTSDDLGVEDLLRFEGYEIVSNKPLKISLIEQDNIEKIMQILKSNNIDIYDVRHEDADLEDSVLNLISK